VRHLRPHDGCEKEIMMNTKPAHFHDYVKLFNDNPLISEMRVMQPVKAASDDEYYVVRYYRSPSADHELAFEIEGTYRS
jgi:hypothetical protein